MNFLGNHQRLVRAVTVLVFGATVFLLYRHFRPDPQVARVKALGKQLGDTTLPAEQRQALGKQLREEVRQLSPEQRGEAFKDREKANQERLTDFFKKSKAEQTAQLDKDIDRMAEFRNQRPQNDGAGPANFGATKGGGAEDRDQRRRTRLDQSTPEQRALNSEYFRMLKERQTQRGLGAGRR